MIPRNQIFNVDCRDGLGRLPDSCIDLVVTSPPYDDLRTYGGLSDWNHHTFTEAARELTRTLKPGGVIVWVVGDETDGTESGTSFKQALHFKDNLGLRLHDTMIYEKVGIAFPSGKNSTRYSQAFEYCFVLSKGKPKTVNLIKDKKNAWAGSSNWGKTGTRQKGGEMNYKPRYDVIQEYGVRTNIWRIRNQKGWAQDRDDAYEHPATMPIDLARDHIISWSNPGDLVLDPFLGSGTTAREAKKQGRDYLGYEINQSYYELSNKLLSELLL